MRSKFHAYFAIGVVAILITAGTAVLLQSSGGKSDSSKLNVVASFYPLGYLTEAIGGDKVEVNTLIPGNTEVHSWSPSASDILAADQADLFVYNGAGLDLWVENTLLPSIDTSDTTVVDTTEGLTLSESTNEDSRLFIYDNDKNQTLVYDTSEGEMVLVKTLPFGLNVTATYSGYFDTALEMTNSEGYVLLFIPNPTNVTVLNTGLHGDHFHDPEVVTVIEVSKPLHSCISSDGQYVAFALDADNAALVIDVDKPADYDVYYDLAGSSLTNHATVVFDGNDLLYYADMRETGDDQKNLMIVDVKNGTVLLSGGFAGESPHGGVYSQVTGKVYLNCAEGIAVLGSNGLENTIPYVHDGGRFSRSWISENGTWLVSYVGNTSLGLAYTKVIAYDLHDGSVAMETAIEVPSMADNGWPCSIYLEESSKVAISDPQTGKVLLIDTTTSTVETIQLDTDAPVSMRLVEDSTTNALWTVTGDGEVYRIDADTRKVTETMELESGLGENIVLSVVSIVSEDEHDHEASTYDPHTWLSPYLARQQAKAIYEALVAEDPNNTGYYTERWETLDTKLADLDERYIVELANTSVDTVFVSHSAYGYLAERYGFEQEGVIGISAEEQPSSSAMAAIVEEMIEDEVYVLYLDPVYTDNYIETMRSNVESLTGHDVQVLKLYLLTGTFDDLDYLEQMEANLESLKTGLGASG